MSPMIIIIKSYLPKNVDEIKFNFSEFLVLMIENFDYFLELNVKKISMIFINNEIMFFLMNYE